MVRFKHQCRAKGDELVSINFWSRTTIHKMIKEH